MIRSLSDRIKIDIFWKKNTDIHEENSSAFTMEVKNQHCIIMFSFPMHKTLVSVSLDQ